MPALDHLVDHVAQSGRRDTLSLRSQLGGRERLVQVDEREDRQEVRAQTDAVELFVDDRAHDPVRAVQLEDDARCSHMGHSGSGRLGGAG